MISDRKKLLYEDFQIRNNLDKNIDTANAFYCGYGNGYADSSEDSYSTNELYSINTELRKENARLREALGFYADKENWNSSKYDDPIFFGEEIGGLRARKALEKSE